MNDKPGTKFILDLLAKSVAKINGSNFRNECKPERKRRKNKGEKFTSKMNKRSKKSCDTNLMTTMFERGGLAIKSEYGEIDKNKIENCELDKNKTMTLRNEISKDIKLKCERNEHTLPPIENKKRKKKVKELKTDLVDEVVTIKTEYVKKEKKTENCMLKTEVGLSVPIKEVNERPTVKKEYIELEDFDKCYELKNIIKTEIDDCERPIDGYETTDSNSDSEMSIETDLELKKESSTGKNFVLGLLARSAEKLQDLDRIKEKKQKVKIELHETIGAERNENIDEKKLNVKLEKNLNVKNIKDNNKIVHESDKVRKARTSGKELRKFTPDEDKILLAEMEEFGNNISYCKLAKELNRTNKTIRVRVEKLKTGITTRGHRAYTLTEDLVIMDVVLKELPSNTLEKLDLPSFKEWKDVGDQIGRQERHVKYRWEYYLKPWLLQHFSGTLNLDIKQMLANYLADNFNEIDNIDWEVVARSPEFAGYTVTSLKYVFFTFLFKHAKEELGVSGADITLRDVADVTNKRYKENRFKKVSENKQLRQRQMIKHFENYIETTGIQYSVK